VRLKRVSKTKGVANRFVYPFCGHVVPRVCEGSQTEKSSQTEKRFANLNRVNLNRIRFGSLKFGFVDCCSPTTTWSRRLTASNHQRPLTPYARLNNPSQKASRCPRGARSRVATVSSYLGACDPCGVVIAVDVTTTPLFREGGQLLTLSSLRLVGPVAPKISALAICLEPVW
jgi:hypothetical protein